MDKNTLLGVLLMGLVIFGFMWLNKPSDEEIARRREQAEMQAEQERQARDNAAALAAVDTLGAAEISDITATVRRYGLTDAATGAITLRAADARITLAPDGVLSGSVAAGADSVSLQSMIRADYGSLPRAVAAEALANLKASVASAARYKEFAQFLSGTPATVTLANDLLTIDVVNRGAAITSARLNKYQRYDSTAVEPIAPGSDSYSFTLTTATQRIDTRDLYFTPTEVTDTSVTMMMDLGAGSRWGIRYTLAPDSYTVRMELIQEQMQQIIPSSVANIDFNWHSRMARNEAGRMFEERNSALYYMFANGDVENLKEGSAQTKEVTERIKWIAYKNQFFSAVVIPDTYFTSATLQSEPLENDPRYLKDMTTEAQLEYSSASATPAAFTLFFGPNLYPLLNDLQSTVDPGSNLHLTNLIPLGWALFRWINTLIIIPVFTFLGGFISNYGIIILLLTVFIKIILFPLTYKSYISQARMRVLAPEIKAINDKWPGQENALKRQQETMALYSRAGASPFSGCLPMLLQFPILIAMFNFFPSAIELRGEPFLWAKDLSAPDAIVSWTANIPLISSTFGNHISLFCLLMTATNIIYTRFTMQSQPTGNSMPGMKLMMYLMPLMFLVFFNNYAAGLSYYYFLSLLITIAQTLAFRAVVKEDDVRARMAREAAKPRKKSGWMARLEEAQRQQQAMLRERERRAQGSTKRRR